MTSITIIPTKDNGIAVVSPYNASFVTGARRLAGKWGVVSAATGTHKAWLFPAEVAADVRALLREVHGEDGTTPVETVRLRVDWDASVGKGRLDAGGNASIVIGGREVAHVFGRDSGARLGENIVVRSGGFRSGGSRKNYCIVTKDGTVFDILRLPRPMAERLVADHPAACRIVADDGTELTETPTGDNVVPLRAGDVS